MLTVGDRLADLLASVGVRAVFGSPGGQTLPLYHGLTRRGCPVRHVTVRDDRSSAYAACGYALVSGNLGVCDATVGAGVVHLVPGLAEAYNASLPVMAITAGLPRLRRHLARRGMAAQGLAQLDLLRPIVKEVFSVEAPELVDELFYRAVRVATSGRPGPVVLDVPEDVFSQAAAIESGAGGETVSISSAAGKAKASAASGQPDAATLAEAAARLAEARRPVLVCGGGAVWSGAFEEVRQLALRVGAAVVATPTGRGIVEDDFPWWAGVVGRFGNRAVRELARDADLLLFIGTKGGQSATLGGSLPLPGQKAICLDVDPEHPCPGWPRTLSLVGDARTALRALLDLLPARLDSSAAWLDRVRQLRLDWARAAGARMRQDSTPLLPQRVMAELNHRSDRYGYLICDASFSSGWGAVYARIGQPGRRLLLPRGLGGLGFAVPAAIGAAAAQPEQRLVCLLGDQAASYSVGEWPTLASLRAPVCLVVLNNASPAWIQLYNDRNFPPLDLGLSPVNFSAIAEASGCRGLRAGTVAELCEALDQALAEERPAVIDVVADPRQTPIPDFEPSSESSGSPGHY